MITKKLADIHAILKAFSYAWQTEGSIKLRVILSTLVALAGLYFHISFTEWTPLVICFGLVFAIELVNTSIENVCDALHPDYDFQIGIAKDLGASASFIAGLIATFVSITTFIPYL